MRWLTLWVWLASFWASSASADLRLHACRVGNETVQCGRLEAPEDWSRPTGRAIALNVIVLPKIGAGEDHAPMVWLEGGPGVPGTISAPLYTAELRFHRQRRAVVLFDQRGTGDSNPLHCPAIEQRSPLEDEWRASDLMACRRTLAARADLNQYSTDAAVRDLEALRQALRAEKLDLAALSYGTWLAQAYMQSYPERIRSAVLIGTVPIGEKLPLHHSANGERALRLLFADCRADPKCDMAFPDLAADWAALQDRLAKGPLRITAPAGVQAVRRGPFNELVRNQLNSVVSARRLPALIHRTARGDFAPLAELVRTRGALPEAEGLYLSVTCPEATGRITGPEIRRATRNTSFARYRLDQQIAACRLWSPRAPARAPSPLTADIPVLLLAGGRDATTPPHWARAVSATLPRSRVVVIEPMSHLPVGLTHIECLDMMMDAFFAKASADGLDTSCIATMKPPAFTTE